MDRNGMCQRLKLARKALGMSQVDVANDVKIQQKTVSDIENCKVMNVPNSYLIYFHQKGIRMEWMYYEQGPISYDPRTVARHEAFADSTLLDLPALGAEFFDRYQALKDRTAQLEETLEALRSQNVAQKKLIAHLEEQLQTQQS